MITPQQAYIIGYFPQVIGFHFNGLEVINQCMKNPIPPLSLRIDSLLESWPRRGPEIVSYVRRVETALQEIGITLTNPPRVAEEYFQWVESIMKKMEAFFAPYRDTSSATSPSEMEVQLAVFRSDWTYRVANKLGDWIHTANLGALVNYLLGAKQDHEFLVLQRQSLQKMATQISSQLQMVEQRTAFLGTFPEATQKAVSFIVQQIEAAPDIATSEDPTAQAALLQKTIASIEKLEIEQFFQFT